jgi:hypothetical protein
LETTSSRTVLSFKSRFFGAVLGSHVDLLTDDLGELFVPDHAVLALALGLFSQEFRSRGKRRHGRHQ